VPAWAERAGWQPCFRSKILTAENFIFENKLDNRPNSEIIANHFDYKPGDMQVFWFGLVIIRLDGG